MGQSARETVPLKAPKPFPSRDLSHSLLQVFFCLLFNAVLGKNKILNYYHFLKSCLNVSDCQYAIVLRKISYILPCGRSIVSDSLSPRTVARQALLSRHKSWSELPLPDHGLELVPPAGPAVTRGFFATEPLGSTQENTNT